MKQLGILKSICLILVLCMIFPAIVACDTENRVEDNTIEKSTTEEVTTEKPTTEKPTTEKPTTEEPATEEPTTEEPTTEEPTTEEPTSCEHEWKDATCEAPRTCLKCNETDGNVGNCNEGNNGRCIYCNKQMRSTEGLIYEISDDGTYVTLTGYIGTNPVVIIADEYQGVPVTKFTWQTFAEKKHIEEIYINNNITEIPGAAFKNCINLMKIEIPDTVTSISDAFMGCTRLEDVRLSNGLTGLEDIFYDNVSVKYNEYDNAFYLGNDDNPYFALIKAKNKSITSCTIHEDTKIIADNAFYGCLELKDVTVSDGIIIGNRAFAGCPYLDYGMDFDSFIKAERGEYVQVRGIVTSISSKSEGAKYNNLYLQDLDGEGGYYIYSIADGIDPVADLGIKLGMTVYVYGTKDIYIATHEIQYAHVAIIDTTEKEIEFIDITDEVLLADSAADVDLTNYQGCWVTIKGVQITGVYEDQYYYKWSIGNVDSYTRLAQSSGLSDEVLKALADGHTAHTGYSADVKGIVNVHVGFYLVPLGTDAFIYGELIG